MLQQNRPGGSFHKKETTQGLPWCLRAEGSALPMPGARVQCPFREQRSRKQGRTTNNRQISEMHSLKEKTRAESERSIQSLSLLPRDMMVTANGRAAVRWELTFDP